MTRSNLATRSRASRLRSRCLIAALLIALISCTAGAAHGSEDPSTVEPDASNEPDTSKPQPEVGDNGSTNILLDRDRDARGESPIPVKPGRPSRYRIEVGLLTEFNDNLFEEDLDDDDCCEEELILTSSARFEAELYRREKSRVKGFARARYHTHNEENDADYADLDVGLRLRHDAHKLGLTYFATPDRPRFREDVSTTTHGVETVLSSELADVVVGELSYEFAHEQYASHESTAEAREKTRGKTNDSHTISTDLRYELTAWIAPSIGFEFEQEDAKDNSENRNEYAPAFALRSFVLDRLYLEMRYRWRYRDYYGNRVDRRNQLDIYANLQLAEHWFLFAFYTFADNSSNSEGDDFRQNDTGLGLSWRWP